jgi:hypothetical protein
MPFQLNIDTQKEMRNYNVPIYGIRGEFSLSGNVRVPYFTALMDISRVTLELKTHEEVSPSLETIYSLVELYQRKIDIDRVKREIVDGYLRSPTKLKFFNSITIALMPKGEDGKIEPNFENYPNNDPPIPDPKCGDFDKNFAGLSESRKAIFGGVQFISSPAENISRLRWDVNRVDAVAVDGQHRLRALKLWMQIKNQQLSEIEKPTRIPVIFLLLHEAAGFAGSAAGKPSGIKPIAREIFTDLNKNAREVDLATQIILDDLSLEAICVRSLITDTTCTDDDRLLPLSLLRWQEANNRFDQKYYLNSLVNLHLLVKDLLNLTPPNPMEKTEVRSFISNLSGLLGTGSPRRLMHNGVSLSEYYESAYFEEGDEAAVAPFSTVPSHYLPSAEEGFKEYFSTWLLVLLKQFRPYSELLHYARVNNLIQGEFAQYLSQPRDHQETLAKDLTHKYGEHWRKLVIDDHSSAIEKIKGVGDATLGEQWAFKTIFQKAIVRFGRTLFVGVAEDERQRFGDINDYICFLNTLYDADAFRVHSTLAEGTFNLWTFVAVNYGNNKIRVTGASETRLLATITLWYFALRLARSQAKQLTLDVALDEHQMSAAEVLKFFSTKTAQAKWPTAHDSYNTLLTLFKDNAQVIKGSTTAPREDEAQRIGKARLDSIFREGVKHFCR